MMNYERNPEKLSLEFHTICFIIHSNDSFSISEYFTIEKASKWKKVQSEYIYKYK